MLYLKAFYEIIKLHLYAIEIVNHVYKKFQNSYKHTHIYAHIRIEIILVLCIYTHTHEKILSISFEELN